jgi:hypothetical protein
MSTTPGADERRIRSLLRRRGVGPDAAPPERTTVSVTVPRDPDWLDQIIADRAPDSGPDPSGPANPGDSIPWWKAGTPAAPAHAPVPEQPGVHVTIVPTPAAPVDPRRARIRWWVLRRLTAAGVGWLTGLGPLAQQRLVESGPGAVGFALLLWLVAWYTAVRVLRLVPAEAIREVHTAADWAAHIPSATVLLALALHTPGAML